MFAFGAENITNQAFWLGYAEMFATYSWFTTYLDRLSQVTPEQVMQVARSIFQVHKRVVGSYIPTGDGGEE